MGVFLPPGTRTCAYNPLLCQADAIRTPLRRPLQTGQRTEEVPPTTAAEAPALKRPTALPANALARASLSQPRRSPSPQNWPHAEDSRNRQRSKNALWRIGARLVGPVETRRRITVLFTDEVRLKGAPQPRKVSGLCPL